MRPIVIDASAGVPLILEEADSPRWRSLVAAWHRDGRRLVVPAHFWLEVPNALLRRHLYAGASVLEALHALDDVVSETVEMGRATLLLAIDHAERFGLTVHDATYLALAETMDAELATADEALRRAAADRLADREPPHRLSEAAAGYASRPVTWPDYSGAASYLASLRAGLRAARVR
jgi:predicted nucleic acid-binding protein